nr:MAG TPA: Protein gp18.1, prophage tail protein gp18.7A [Caudoviricetes sp.]
MEFIIANANKMEEGELPDSFSVDFDIGDTNDVEITCPRGSLAFGMYLICPGTEYGALIEESDSWTNSATETWRGNAFRKFLQQYIIEPPSGQDYRTVSGDAHDVFRQIIGSVYDGLFTIPEEKSGIDVGIYKFDRYTDALTGFTKMLKRVNARVNIEIKQGDANEPFSVILSAVPIQNLSSEIEYSQDSKIAINMSESRRGINHLICLGKGELKNRQVVHLYVQLDGSISQKKYYTGLNERMAVYDYSNAESIEDLTTKGKEQLVSLMGKKVMAMSVQDVDVQIGDIIGGRDYEKQIYLQKPVVQKIVKIEQGDLSIEYKVEGEE